MDIEEIKKFESIALERLRSTRDEEEKWSFLFRTDGSVGLLCCPWTTAEDWDFDGEFKELSLPWSDERMRLIEAGSDLTDDELDQWRRAKCRQLASGSDWSVPAWIVPLRIKNSIEAWALFLCGEDADPSLEGVFDSLEEATAALINIAAIAA